MLIAISFGGYSKYRFHRPWISKVVEWLSGKSPDVSWGKYQGDEEGGDVEIIATPGDIVRWGQKGPSPRQTRSYWGIVQENGSVEKCSMTQAHKAWKQKLDAKPDAISSITTKSVSDQLGQFSTDQLLAELHRREVSDNENQADL